MQIGVFFNAPQYDGYPFDDEEYITAYHELARALADRGADFFIVRSQPTYRGKNEFFGGWKFDGTTFQRYEGSMRLDVLFNKGNFIADASARVINDPELENLCTDKFLTYQSFSELCPWTTVVKNQQELAQCIAFAKEKHQKMIVAKPLDKEGGAGVFIGAPDEVAAQVQSFPYLLQEFLDTSSGIPGIATGVHDLRMIGVAGQLVVAYIRQAKEGSWLANVSRGGSIREVPLEALPKEALEIYNAIDAKLSKYKYRIFSVDLGRKNNGTWKLIELNSKPGLSPMCQDAGSVRFTVAIADLLVRCAKEICTKSLPQ